MSNLLKEIEAQIAGTKTTTAKENVGVIREIGDGVAKIEGLTDAMLNEMIDLGKGVTGLALNLDETEVGVVVLGDYTQLKEGDEARTTGKVLQVPDQERRELSGGKNRARYYPSPFRQPADADRDHAD